MDKTWDSLESLLDSRRRLIADMLTSGGGDINESSGSSTDVYKLLSDLYMQTCSVKVSFTFFHFYHRKTLTVCVVSVLQFTGSCAVLFP